MAKAISKEELDLLGNTNRHIVPIAEMTGKKLRVVGTGVYVKAGDSTFIVTANHVLNEGRSNLYIPWLPGKIFKIEMFRAISVSHPEADVAVLLMRGESPEFVPISIQADSPEVGTEMLLAGFPASRSSSFNNTMRYEARFLKTETIENSGRFSVFSDKINFVCDFYKENILLGGGHRGDFVDPWGMSGGAALEIQYVNGEYEYRLAGIITDWDPKKKQFIRCTNTVIMLDLINNLAASGPRQNV